MNRSQLSVAEESTDTAMNRNQLSVAEESTGTAMIEISCQWQRSLQVQQ